MTNLITSDKQTVVVGLGATGLAVARYLARTGRRFVVVDSRAEPPGLSALARELPEVPVELGGIRAETLCAADTLVLSPGVPRGSDPVRRAEEAGVAITGDIQLFADAANAPFIAITGSNGKSTVTTLVGEMASAAGKRVAVGGNLGTPALDLLADGIDLYVLELSSFQLELVDNLGAEAATVLNVSPDHMDRYPDLISYHRAKHRIFQGARHVVVNRDDTLSRPLFDGEVGHWDFSLGRPDLKAFGILERDGQDWLAFGLERLMPVAEVAMRGRHNLSNAMAAVTLGRAAGLPLDPMLDTLRTFKGLPHRCETVAEKGGVAWIDDSKATNVGATVAAIEGFAATEPNLILIAGGQGKGQNFTPLAKAAEARVRLAVLMGEDARRLAEPLETVTEVVYATSMASAVGAAARAAQPGDTVLLSPACASFDMFEGFEDRGRQFAAAVEGLS